MTDSSEELRDELYQIFTKRVVFQSRLATGGIIAVILFWYLFQIAVLFAGWSPELILWVFTTESFPVLSPGLFLAIISHSFFPQVTHVMANVAMLWVFAGESEQHMRRWTVVLFFMTAGLISVLGSTAISGSNTLGASGAALAFVGFYSTHRFLDHRGQLRLDLVKHGPVASDSLRVYWDVSLVIVPLVLLLYFLAQWTGQIPSGRTDVLGHSIGLVYGIVYAILRTQFTDEIRC
jgi:membrane associated rhomboid family serine protease